MRAGHPRAHLAVLPVSRRWGRAGAPPQLRAARHQSRDSWYLDAHDLDREGERTFRLDRMEEVEQGPRTTEPKKCEKNARREVDITFGDPHYLDLLPWHGLRVTGNGEDGSVSARIDYYGGMWLPRMIAACGGTARTADPEVARLALEYARGLLK